MRKVLAIAWNDIQNEFAERSTLIFFLVLPLVFTAIIGAALQNTYSDGSEDPRLPVLVVNADEGDYSTVLLDLLNASDTVRMIPVSEAESLGMLEDGYPALLKIPLNFSDRLSTKEPAALELIKLEQNNQAMGIEQAVKTALNRLNASAAIAEQSVAEAEKIQPFVDAAERQEYYLSAQTAAQQSLANPPSHAITTYAEDTSPKIATGNEQSSPGQLVTWVLITLVGGSEIFVDERLKGTLKRLLATPTSRGVIITGKIAGRLGLGIIQMALLVGFGAVVLKVNWGRSPGALAIMLLSFGLAGTALGVMLGAFARTRKQASGLTTLFSMLLAALGGAWWPIEVTPTAYQAAVQVLPSTWAMRGFNDVILRGQGVAGILPEAGILMLFAAAFFIIGILRLNKE